MYPHIYLLLKNCIRFSGKDSKIGLHVPSANGDPSRQHDCTVAFSLHPNEFQIDGCDTCVSILVSLALELLLIYTILSDATVIGLATINISLVKPSACSEWSGNPIVCILKIHFFRTTFIMRYLDILSTHHKVTISPSTQHLMPIFKS